MKHLGGHLDITHIDKGALLYLIDRFSPSSFLDIGCGPGGQVKAAKEAGIKKALGVDGDPNVSSSDTITHDFTKGPLNLPDKFDLGWSCEFVEHVKDEFIPNFMHTFSFCSVVAITHAPPGTPGYHHVNCQDTEYWVDIFKSNGFSYMKKETEGCRKSSTMKRDFFRDNGLIFKYN